MRGVTQLEYTPEIAREVFNRMCELSSPELRLAVLFELFPLAKINEVPNDATAFSIRGPAQNIMCLVSWDDKGDGDVVRREEETERGRQLARLMTDIIANAEKAPEESKMRAYGNYGKLKGTYPFILKINLTPCNTVGDEKLEMDRAQKVFGDNYPRLQQIKGKYDPDMVFSKWFTIVPA